MHPIIFDSSLFIIYSLWLFFALGFAVASLILYHLIQNNRLQISFITDHSLKYMLGALICSRIFAIINNPSYFFRIDPETGFSIFSTIWNFITVWDKELSFWGAVFGFFYMFIRQAKKQEENFAKWSDIITISLLAGISLGNIGAYLDGVNYGSPTDLFWGVTYQSSFVKYAVPVHPTQIYAFIYSGLIAIFLYTLYKRYRGNYDGLVTYTGFFLFSIFRFLEGFLRGDDVLMFGPFRAPQVGFFLLAIISGYLMRKYQIRYQIPIFSLITKNLPWDKIKTIPTRTKQLAQKAKAKAQTIRSKKKN